eukprot:CAMPEP_0114411178 /NCGR_PEP_ID=MMETSP0102-20121206/24513_1 /TAXON_ID=38822 ORGANISM="Pteridomonas danica, Strain PT" /NCGR_SAMPLE_ID=MMETSP0102 /ASSEMBLY_ACC=CAM_ASM_000212 /LENGTH=296 /DNA_ID=CAMNT_0001579047 /DNA_START=192 /DNA_END=1078 /DNA_ORIENTATION=-
MKDKAQFGWRSVFKHVHESVYIDKCSEGRRLNEANTTVCRDIEDPIECEDEPECEYDYQFLTCFESNSPLPTTAPTISAPPTVTPYPTVLQTTLLPTPAPTPFENTPSPSATPGPSTTSSVPTATPSFVYSPAPNVSPSPLPSAVPTSFPTYIPSSSPLPTEIRPSPVPSPTPTEMPATLQCLDPHTVSNAKLNVSCEEPLVVSFLTEGGAAEKCESYTFEVYSSLTDSMLETVTLSSSGEVAHFYSDPSRRKLSEAEGTRSKQTRNHLVRLEKDTTLVDRKPGSILEKVEEKEPA